MTTKEKEALFKEHKDSKRVYVTADGSVFLDSNKNDAHDHQRELNKASGKADKLTEIINPAYATEIKETEELLTQKDVLEAKQAELEEKEKALNERERILNETDVTLKALEAKLADDKADLEQKEADLAKAQAELVKAKAKK